MTPLSLTPQDREGLWAGDVEVQSPEELVFPPLWLALRVIPGEDPDVDTWVLKSGMTGPLPSLFRCGPERRGDGWELSGCAGTGALQITVFVPAHGETGLQINAQHPRLTISGILSLVPERDEPRSSPNVTLLWNEKGGGIHSDIWAADGLVFAPHYSDRDIEVLDAETGTKLGSATVPEPEGGRHNLVFDVKAHGGFLYAATASTGLIVFDVSTPTTPELIGQYYVLEEEGSAENFVDIHNIFLSPDGRYVYAINTSSVDETERRLLSDLRIIDVSDPRSPKEAGRFTKEGPGKHEYVHDVNVIERGGRLIAFLNYLRAGLWVLDVTDPTSIAVKGSIKWDGVFSHSGWPFALGDRLYYAHTDEGYDKNMTVLDVTDLTNPLVVSRFRTRPGLSIHNVEVVGGIAYISYYVDGLRVVDLRVPEVPREIGHYDTVPAEDELDILHGAWGVRVYDGVVYISDTKTGTYAFNVKLD